MPPPGLYYRVSLTGTGAAEDLTGYVAAVEVEEDEARPSRCTARVGDPFVVLARALREGTGLEVELGEAAQRSVVFRGRVHRVEERYAAGEPAVLLLYADDNLMRLGLRPRSRLWTNTTLTAIADAVCGDHRLPRGTDALAADPAFGATGVRQQDETDLAFLSRLAAANACLLNLRSDASGDRVALLGEARLGSAAPALVLSLDADAEHPLTSFQARYDLAGLRLPAQLAAVDGRTAQATGQTEPAPSAPPGNAADPRLTTVHRAAPDLAALLDRLIPGAEQAAAAVAADLGGTDTASAPPVAAAAELRDQLANRSERFRTGMTATGTTPGSTLLRPLATVRVEGVGGRFSGAWLVATVRHVVDDTGYHCEFGLRR